MPESFPPLGKFFIAGFSANDEAYPIVGQLRDKRAGGWELPASLSTCPESKINNIDVSACVFTGTQPMEDDRFVMLRWEILPGPEITGATQNSNGVAGEIAKQRVEAGTAADTGPDVLESEVDPQDSVVSLKTTRTGELWSASGKAVVFGIEGTVLEAVASSAAVSTGINVESSSGNAQDALRFHNQTVTIPWSDTTVASKVVGRRGFIAAHAVTWTAPSATPATQSALIEVDLKLESATRRRQDAYTYADGSPIKTKEVSRFAGVDVSTDTYAAPTVTPVVSTAGAWTVERLIQEKEKEARLISKVIATGEPIIIYEKVDPRVPGSRQTVEYSIVQFEGYHVSDTNTITYELMEHPEHPLLRIQKKITYDVPDTYVEWVERPNSYPSYFEFYYQDDLQGTTRLGRSGPSRTVPHKITHLFSAPTLGTTPSPPSPYVIIELNDLFFSVPIVGLRDAGTAYRTNNGIQYSRDYAASSPSLAAYKALVAANSLITIGGGVEVWRAGIFEKTTIEVQAY